MIRCLIILHYWKKESYEYVDLGLPSGLLWATCNVGATSPEEYGLYFQWGDTVGHPSSEASYFIWKNCPYQTVDTGDYSPTKFTKYLGSTTSSYKDPSATDADALKTVLDLEDDAAHVHMGGEWRMPTSTEFQELYDNTTCTWTIENGVYGRKFTSKAEGNTNYIFIPAAGECYNGSVGYVGSSAYVWSSSLLTSRPCGAYFLYFTSSKGSVNTQNSNYRYYGFSVRGVKPKQS